MVQERKVQLNFLTLLSLKEVERRSQLLSWSVVILLLAVSKYFNRPGYFFQLHEVIRKAWKASEYDVFSFEASKKDIDYDLQVVRSILNRSLLENLLDVKEI